MSFFFVLNSNVMNVFTIYVHRYVWHDTVKLNVDCRCMNLLHLLVEYSKWKKYVSFYVYVVVFFFSFFSIMTLIIFHFILFEV